MTHFFGISTCGAAILALCGCANQVATTPFRMPDNREAAFVSLPGNGMTPPVVAIITPKASSYNVQVVSAIPLAQSALSGAVAGAEIGGGLAAGGALIRPDRVNNNASVSASTSSNATAIAQNGAQP